METRIVKVSTRQPIGHFTSLEGPERLETFQVDTTHEAYPAIEEAASHLRERDTPVAFPTETVYGLGADATRSASVRGIYAAKNRPADNPLIVHVSDLDMLRSYLGGDDIPEKYQPLIDRFWPGPLTMLMPNPEGSRLAPEVTAGLKSFGARMPSTSLALSLIKLTGRPLAAPSANASTKPSPTMAQHVKYDLDGRIELILDGGPCEVGVESTVVDGLCDPPALLRPGGIGIDELRKCPGWENVVKAYKDQGHDGKTAPRAPGMKYKHYSPKARVILYEATCADGSEGITAADAERALSPEDGAAYTCKVGVIRTKRWRQAAGLRSNKLSPAVSKDDARDGDDQQPGTSYQVLQGELVSANGEVRGGLLDIDLGRETRGIAQGLFSALRELDQLGAAIIFVDGIDDELDIAGAVMNRLRKAASEIRV